MASRIELDPQLESSVDDLVRSGRYASRTDVLREGVRLLEERERGEAHLKALIQAGLDDIEAGRVQPMETVVARLVEEIDRLPRTRA